LERSVHLRECTRNPRTIFNNSACEFACI